jgi:23S rRNA (cytosine1962-C5)-methyltransferase
LRVDRPNIRLKPREGRRARTGAPWIFSNEIVMDASAKSLAPGSLVNVVGDDGRSFGTGYFNAATLVALRLFEVPADTKIDHEFLAGRISRALTLRQALFDGPYYRLVHAEGDGLPGLVIDRFGDALVVQITTAGMESLLDSLLEAVKHAVNPSCVVLRADTPSRALEGLPLYSRTAKGNEPRRLEVEENGTRYFGDPIGGQKTGWYFDHRDNRAFMARLAKEKSVLDAYCYTGGFAILAARFGAREASGIDSSTPALHLAEEAAVANGVARACRFVKSDVMDELERLSAARECFDLVIADPPPFVPARKDLEAGAHAYRKLARLAASTTRANGYLMLASCSHNMPPERFAQECAIGIARAGRRGALIRQAGAGPDHPVHPMLPQTSYLKTLVYALN